MKNCNIFCVDFNTGGRKCIVNTPLLMCSQCVSLSVNFYLCSNDCVTRTMCVLWCMCLSLSLSATPLDSSYSCEKETVCQSSFPNTASHTVRPLWTRNGFLLEVADGNWAPYGPRLNHKVSEESGPPDARYARPTGVLKCHWEYCTGLEGNARVSLRYSGN